MIEPEWYAVALKGQFFNSWGPRAADGEQPPVFGSRAAAVEVQKRVRGVLIRWA